MGPQKWGQNSHVIKCYYLWGHEKQLVCENEIETGDAFSIIYICICQKYWTIVNSTENR